MPSRLQLHPRPLISWSCNCNCKWLSLQWRFTGAVCAAITLGSTVFIWFSVSGEEAGLNKNSVEPARFFVSVSYSKLHCTWWCICCSRLCAVSGRFKGALPWVGMVHWPWLPSFVIADYSLSQFLVILKLLCLQVSFFGLAVCGSQCTGYARLC